MVLLTKDDVCKRFTRQEDPLNQDDLDSIFEDDEDDFDGLSLPSWVKGDTPSSPLDAMYTATPLTASGVGVNFQGQLPVFNSLHQCHPTVPHSSALDKILTATTTETVANPVINNSIYQVLTTSPLPVNMNKASPWTMVTTATATRPTAISSLSDTSQQFVAQTPNYQYPSISTTLNLQDLYPQSESKPSTLGQFRTSSSINANQPTPLMDEPQRESPAIVDILPTLIGTASEYDPLMLEIQAERSHTSEKRGCEPQEEDQGRGSNTT